MLLKFKEHWISVEKELPPISTAQEKHQVIIFCTVIGVTTGFYWGKTKDTDPCKGWSIMGVTHWSPMLESP